MRGLGNGFLSLSEILTILSIKLQKRLIVLYLFLHRTTTLPRTYPIVLSYISFLHQTTTISSMFDLPLHCLISLFYIKPQPGETMTYLDAIVLYLFSTSNHNSSSSSVTAALLSYISFLHQTTTISSQEVLQANCLISLFYIKPQQMSDYSLPRLIVLYLFSTSNHNIRLPG